MGAAPPPAEKQLPLRMRQPTLAIAARAVLPDSSLVAPLRLRLRSRSAHDGWAVRTGLQSPPVASRPKHAAPALDSGRGAAGSDAGLWPVGGRGETGEFSVGRTEPADETTGVSQAVFGLVRLDEADRRGTHSCQIYDKYAQTVKSSLGMRPNSCELGMARWHVHERVSVQLIWV